MERGIERRAFLGGAALAAGAFAIRVKTGGAPALLQGDSQGTESAGGAEIAFETSDAPLQALYQKALNVLAGNVQVLHPYQGPVLIEGSVYRGIWLECAPQEGLAYAAIRPDVARNNHMAFFKLQREDGQIPATVKAAGVGLGQIQMVVPIASTAWELVQQTGDHELLESAYMSCARWDAWLGAYRDTRHTGLCEGFCTYDTGHDNSPRWTGLPSRCPDGDARKCPVIPSLPRLCPDLSATVYGGRVALAAMARALAKTNEADRWTEEAEAIRGKIGERLYDAADAAFYDRDAEGRFVRIRGDVISRVLGEHVVDQELFETIYRCQMHNPAAFWVPYPFPSIALDDPTFVRPIPRNSWGGATQALTALRAPRWMEHYGKPADLAHVMQQWVSALLRAGDFGQQMDPLTGVFSADPAGYSPAALVLRDFTWRLWGVRRVEDRIEWNVRPQAKGTRASFCVKAGAGTTAELRYEAGEAELRLNGRVFWKTSSVVRLMTDRAGMLDEVVGIGAEEATVELRTSEGKARRFAVKPNETVRDLREASGRDGDSGMQARS